MGEIMEQLPPGAHFQAAVQTLIHKYDLPGLWYLDLWPVACGQLIITDPDVALHVTVTQNHPKHEAEKWAVDPLIGSENIVTSEGPLWKSLHKMISPAFSVQNITTMRPAVCKYNASF
jgi:cytochrome P450